MATIKAVNSHASIGRAVKYVMQDAKRTAPEGDTPEQSLAEGINCFADNAMEQMMLTKRLWEKTGGRTYKHFTQNFAPGESTPEEAHRIGLELAERMEAWKGFEVLVVTHTDKHYWHNHFIVNSVNIDDGHKLQWKKHDLEETKRINDELCLEHGLSVPEKGKTYDGRERTEATTYSRTFYENFLKENAAGKDTDSYIFNIAVEAMHARAIARDKEEFIKLMAEKDIGVRWEDNRKYITFTDLERQRNGEKKCGIRNNKLEQYFHVPFGKEELQHGFDENRNRDIAEHAQRERAAAQTERAKKAGSGEQPAQGSIDRVRREVREIAEGVEGLTGEKRRAGSQDGRSDPGERGAAPERQRDTRKRNIQRDQELTR
ncbi:MAG: relaxase [Lachnospiraceae bacterium]|nr:relaxase [Lachnospiraceae bacterium]